MRLLRNFLTLSDSRYVKDDKYPDEVCKRTLNNFVSRDWKFTYATISIEILVVVVLWTVDMLQHYIKIRILQGTSDLIQASFPALRCFAHGLNLTHLLDPTQSQAMLCCGDKNWW